MDPHPMAAQSVLAGDGLVLRRYRDDDVDDITAACNDELIRRFDPIMPSPFTRHDAMALINAITAPAQGGTFVFADPATGRLLGAGGIRRGAELTAEIGYWVAPWARGRGVATAAARLLASHAFDLGVQRVSLRTEWENTASQRVAIAAGFSREGVQREGGASRDGSRHDLIVWGRLHTDPDGPTKRVLPDLPGHTMAGRGHLTDGVVTLRPLTAADADDTYGLRSLPEVVATSVPPQPRDRAVLERLCARSEAGWLAGERADFTVRDAATDRYAGEIGLYYWEPATQQAMIGYSTRPEWRGRGYTSRAARLITAWAFDVVGVARVVAGTAPDNLASQRVLVSAGFTNEGYQRARLPGPHNTRIDNIQYVRLPRGTATADGSDATMPRIDRDG